MMKQSKQFKLLQETFRKNPKKAAMYLGCVSMVGLWLLWPSPAPLQSVARPSSQKEVTDSLETAVDPRYVWAENLRQEMKNIEVKMGTKDRQLDRVLEQLESLKENQNRVAEKAVVREVSLEPQVRIVAPKKPKTLGYMSQVFEVNSTPERTPENYVSSGAFARAVLLTGVVAETGVQAASEPQPILLRLVDHGIFSKGYKTEQITDAIIIGSCTGNISSERAVCRLETISLMNKEKTLLEKPVEGWIIGEDGRPGIRGEVVDKATDVARMAVLSGILGGIAGFFQNQATSSVFPVSPLTGQSNALAGTNALKAGTASGVGSALTKLADYAIKRAEQMNPVIIVGSGRVIDVVFKKGFSVKTSEKLDGKPPLNKNIERKTSSSTLQELGKNMMSQEQIDAALNSNEGVF